MNFSAIFAIVVGVGMIGQWSFAYFKRQIPELVTEPIRIKFHIAAEFITALTLITAGLGLLTNQIWLFPIFPMALGMLLYTVIISPGYFAQKGEWVWVGMFAIILLLVLVSLYLVFNQS